MICKILSVLSSNSLTYELALDGCSTADTAYDSNAVYYSLANHFSDIDIVISPRNNATGEKHHHWMPIEI